MRHIALLSLAFSISACSHINILSNEENDRLSEPNSLAVNEASVIKVPESSSKPQTNKVARNAISQTSPQALELKISTPPYLAPHSIEISDTENLAINAPTLLGGPSETVFSSLNLNYSLIDDTDFETRDKENSTRSYEQYGFITPTEELEQEVNNELKILRDESVTPAGHNNLVDEIRKHFKLDLSLDNKRIRSQLNWYVNNPDYLDRTFKRSARYLYHVVQEVKKRNLPMEIALLPFVESAYDPFAYSHGRASGLWQFIPGTGKMYGMHQNWWYDGRRDVLASTTGALDYLTYLSNRFDGDWLHALASYNSGSGRVSKAIKRNKKKGKDYSFWSLKLPRETRAYVPKLLALAKIVKSPETYNIKLPAVADTPYFEVVPTEGQIDLAQAATLAGVDIKEIYKLNPGFNQWASAPMGPHRLLVPVENAQQFKNALLDLPPTKRLNWTRYTIKPGDSLIRIAKKFNTTPALIKEVNQLRSNLIRAKQKLLIPVAAQSKGYYNLSQHSRLKRKQDKLKGSQGSKKLIHTVRPGDTMWDLSIAHKVGVRSLAKWNGMAPTDPIKPGQKLVIWSRKELGKAKPAIPNFRDKKTDDS